MITKIIISFLVFITTISIHAQWVSKKNTQQLPMWSVADCIDALSPDTVVISIRTLDMNYSGLILTENKGLNWIEIPGGEGATDISICSNSSIWTATGGAGKIYNTKNKGVSWEIQFYDTNKTKFMNYVKMFDDNNGIAMGDAREFQNGIPLFLKTTNGGNDWIDMNKNYEIGGWSGDTWRRLDFINENFGYFYESGNNPQKLYKTIDGGASWSETNYTGNVQILKFYNQNLGLTFSYKYDGSTNPATFTNFFRRTTDGGDTWEEYQVDIDSWGNDIEFVPGNPSNVWFTNTYGLYYSNDTGKTWQEYDLGIDTLRGRDIVFTDENHGWLLCDNGNIFYTDNNGGIITGIDEENSENKIPQNFILYQNYPNPFNPATLISYSLKSPGSVNLAVYDISGQLVKVLVDEQQSTGYHKVSFNGDNLSSGVYIYRLETSDYSSIKKMLLLK